MKKTFEPRSVPTATIAEDLIGSIQYRLAEEHRNRIDLEVWKTLTNWALRGPWRSWG